MVEIKSITSNEELEEVLNNEKDRVVLLKFQAEWCGPCRLFSENLRKLTGDIENKLLVLEADVEKAEALAEKYGVRSIPVSYFFRNGEMVKKTVGLMTEEGINNEVKEIAG